MKYAKILTGLLPEIMIQCRPKISPFFENPKILTNTKIGHEFLALKT